MTVQDVITLWWNEAAPRKDVERLSALIARHCAVDFVRCQIANGADGDDDIRIETQVSGQQPVVVRWRGGVITDVHERGQRLGDWLAGAQARTELRQEILGDSSTSTWDRERVLLAMNTLKRWRVELLERREARVVAGQGTAAIDTAISNIDAKLQAARTRLLVLKGG